MSINPCGKHTAKLVSLVMVLLFAGCAKTAIKYEQSIDSVKIDCHGEKFKKMVADGSYGWVSPDVTAERFPIKCQTEDYGIRCNTDYVVDITLVSSDGSIRSEKLIKLMGSRGFRPARSEELLALAREHPDLQKQFPIIALGSVAEVGGYRAVLCLGYYNYDGLGLQRGLDIVSFDNAWYDHYQFAFVKQYK